MAEALTILTQLSVLLIIGLFCIALSSRLQISRVLPLLLAGLIIGKFTDFFSVEGVFLVSLATVTLALVIFDGASKLSYRQINKYSGPAFKLTFWHVVLTGLIAGFGSYILFFHGFEHAVLLSVLLGIVLVGTDAGIVLLMLKEQGAKIGQLLAVEAVINTPFVVVLPFILLDTITEVFTTQLLVGIIQQIIVGIGAGVVLGLLILKTLRKLYSQDVSTATVIATALLSYILAENLGGSGVLAVATLGLMFGNFSFRNKDALEDFAVTFNSILEILIFLLIGILIGGQMPLTLGFLFKTLILFVALIGARFAAVWITMRSQSTTPEMVFLSLSIPKGLAVAVLIFTFALEPIIPEILLTALFAVSLYTVIAATATAYWWQSRKEPTSTKSSGGSKSK